MKFNWIKDYELNIKIIDKQHHHYFDIVNKIYEELDQPFKDKEKILHILNELVEYTKYHFHLEETYFKKFNYVDAKNHIAIHHVYKDLLMNYYAQALKVKNNQIEELFSNIAEFVTDWFTNHIMVVDKKYYQCFKDHGLK